MFSDRLAEIMNKYVKSVSNVDFSFKQGETPKTIFLRSIHSMLLVHAIELIQFYDQEEEPFEEWKLAESFFKTFQPKQSFYIINEHQDNPLNQYLYIAVIENLCNKDAKKMAKMKSAYFNIEPIFHSIRELNEIKESNDSGEISTSKEKSKEISKSIIKAREKFIRLIETD